MTASGQGKLLAISDLHVGYQENRQIVAELAPHGEHDWLLVAGDVGDVYADVEWALRQLAGRFARVVWVPGNHELSTATEDWHRRYGAAAMVYGHLHIPRRIWRDGVPFDEVSLGYPREWSKRGPVPQPVRRLFTEPG